MILAKKTISLVLGALAFYSSMSFAQPMERPPGPRGPIDDCLQSAYLYSVYDNIQADCTVNYVHFHSREKIELQKKPDGQIRIASFNAYHLGDEQAIMKNYALVAKMMNQWDIVGTQELMPLPGYWANHNDLLASIVKDSQPLEIQVVEPGYYRLLKKLQELDPSWSLILQSMPEGTGPAGEMSGFYYRAQYVQPKKWDYCDLNLSADLKTSETKPNFACNVRVNDEKRKMMARNGFTTYFESIGFDFVGISFHARFRSIEKSLVPKIIDAICENMTDPKCKKMPADEAGRFYETKMIMDDVPYMQRDAHDPDVIFMGDFNIEILDKNQIQWQAAFSNTPGFQVFQSDKTSLSLTKKSLASNYDHFILNPQVTSQCDIQSIRPFDFTKPKNEPKHPVMLEILKQSEPETLDRSMTHHLALLGKISLSEKTRGSTQISLRGMNDRERLELTTKFVERTSKMQKNSFYAAYEMISDHLPIEMNCRINP